MIKKLPIISLLILLQTSTRGNILGVDPEAWKRKHEAELLAAQNGTIAEAWELLNSYFNSYGRDYPDNLNKSTTLLYQRAQEIMMSKPGYAHWVRSEVERLLVDYQTAETAYQADPTPQNLRLFRKAQSTYFQESSMGITTLAYLPGKESVEVLGEFLSDERTGAHSPHDVYTMDAVKARHSSNAINAALALKRMRIGPIPGGETLGYSFSATAEDVEIYRRWWADVKAGKQDYVFGWEGWKYEEGKHVMLPKNQWPPDPFSSKKPRKTNHPTPSKTPTPSHAPTQSRWPLALAALAVLAALGFLLRGRMSA